VGGAALPDAITSLLTSARRAKSAVDAKVILVAPLDTDLSTAIAQWQVDPAKVVAVDPMFVGPTGVTLMTNPATTAASVAAAKAVFAAQSVPSFVIADSPGYVAPRVVACLINLACEMAQQGIASPEDIDIAVRLGLGYPTGPFEWGDRLSPRRVLHVMQGLYKTFGDQRYRPAPWLVRRAHLGLSLSAPDRQL
jgi:3-hydroxybutyryl-CoA dehydrogenase